MHRLLPVLAFALFSSPVLAETGPKAGQASLDFGLGWEYMKVGAVKFGGKYNGNLLSPTPLVSSNEQHDGGFDGLRMDTGLNMAAQSLGLPAGTVSLKGFYARHSEKTNLSCHTDSISAYCDSVPLFDPDAGANNTLGSGVGENVTYTTDRTLRHWGAAIELKPDGLRFGPLSNILGIGYRSIDQDMTLNSTWSGSSNFQHYRETLDTGYIGAYWGVDGRQPLTDGIDLVYAGDAGAYWAHTGYDGSLTQHDHSGTTFSQSLNRRRDDAAFIGTLSLALEKKFQALTLSGYTRGEYYSYAPQMKYSQYDKWNAGVLAGSNATTSIDATDAYSVTVGIRVSVPLGGS